jgi:MFS-type transporter involved in bile tolerance (Atg22 family)
MRFVTTAGWPKYGPLVKRRSSSPSISPSRIVGLLNSAFFWTYAVLQIPAGWIVAPILTGWLLQKTASYEAPTIAILVVLVVGVLSYLLMIREKYAPKPIQAVR